MQVEQGYKKLIVYQKSLELVLLVYEVTSRFPRSERYVLLPQIRRAAISILANVVEGYAKSRKEFIRFLSISIGSLTEVEVFLELSMKLQYLKEKEFNSTYNLLMEVKRFLYSYQKSLKVKID